MESNNIVIGVDGSAPSWDALYWAVREAMWRQAELRVVFIDVGPWPDPASAGRKLAHMVADARRLEPAVSVTGRVAEGDAVSALCAASARAALLVVGDAEESGERTALGRAGREVATRISAPVVVVRGHVPGERRPIVVGTDGSAGAQTAMELAFEEARLRDCPLIAVFAYGQPAQPLMGEDDPHPRLTEGSAGAALDETLTPWRDRFPRVSVEATTTDNEPTPALIALSRHAQLVVVGAHGHGDSHDLLGSVPQRVLDRSYCPVLISR